MNFDKISFDDSNDSNSMLFQELALHMPADEAAKLVAEYQHALANAAAEGALDPTHKRTRARRAAQRAKNSSAFKVGPYSSRTDFPLHITHRDITTKPEDQGDYGTCAMWTVTTVCEMIVWKLTGQYIEFSDDEIYNIYLDCAIGQYEYAVYNKQVNSALSVIDCSRKAMRKSATEWDIPDECDTGEVFYINQQGLVLGDNAIAATAQSPWYAIYHYNDPDRRKNHYPDTFSKICFIAKNYIYDSIYRMYNSSGKNMKADQPSPYEIMHWAFSSNFPLRCGIPGHAAAFYDIDNVDKHIDLNSSWSTDEICQLRFPYKTSKPYYSSCMNMLTGKNDTRFNAGVYSIEYFDRKLDSTSNVHKLTILQNNDIDVIGAADVEMFKDGASVQLSACPSAGHYFSTWSDGVKQNPRTVEMTADIELCAIASSTLDTNVQCKVNVISSSYYTITGATDGQTVQAGTKLTLECKCNGKAEFIEWSNGETANPLDVIVSHDIVVKPVIKPDVEVQSMTIRTDDYLIGHSYPTGYSSIYQYVYTYGNDKRRLIHGFDCSIATIEEHPYEDGGALKLQATGMNIYQGTAIATKSIRRGQTFRAYVCLDNSKIIDNADTICTLTLTNTTSGTDITMRYNLMDYDEMTITPSMDVSDLALAPDFYTSKIYFKDSSTYSLKAAFNSGYTLDKVIVIQHRPVCFTKLTDIDALVLDDSTAAFSIEQPSATDPRTIITAVVYASQITN